MSDIFMYRRVVPGSKAFEYRVELTPDAVDECFSLTINHREYLIHTTELLSVYHAARGALDEWFDRMSTHCRERVCELNPDFHVFLSERTRRQEVDDSNDDDMVTTHREAS